MATRTIEDILREALAKCDGNPDAALSLVRAWSNADSSIREVIEASAWEWTGRYLAELKEAATNPA